MCCFRTLNLILLASTSRIHLVGRIKRIRNSVASLVTANASVLAQAFPIGTEAASPEPGGTSYQNRGHRVPGGDLLPLKPLREPRGEDRRPLKGHGHAGGDLLLLRAQREIQPIPLPAGRAPPRPRLFHCRLRSQYQYERPFAQGCRRPQRFGNRNALILARMAELPGANAISAVAIPGVSSAGGPLRGVRGRGGQPAVPCRGLPLSPAVLRCRCSACSGGGRRWRPGA